MCLYNRPFIGSNSKNETSAWKHSPAVKILALDHNRKHKDSENHSKENKHPFSCYINFSPLISSHIFYVYWPRTADVSPETIRREQARRSRPYLTAHYGDTSWTDNRSEPAHRGLSSPGVPNLLFLQWTLHISLNTIIYLPSVFRNLLFKKK